MLRVCVLCFVTSSLLACDASRLLPEDAGEVLADAGVVLPLDSRVPLTPPLDSASQKPSDGAVGPEDTAILSPPDLWLQPPLGSCDDGDPVDLSDPRRELRSDIVIIERHFADGSLTQSEVSATFEDYSLYKGTPAATESFGINCVGIVGPAFVPGAKHCEYSTTACGSDVDCGDGVSCRETDRLDAASISFQGLAISPLEFDKQGIGRFHTTGLGPVFSPIAESVSGVIAKGDAHPHYDENFYWFFSGVLAPKEVKVHTPDLSGGTLLGDGDLVFQWTQNSYHLDFEADLITIELRAGPSEAARRLRCVAKDDGCKTIPAAAMKWLTGSLTGGAQLEVLVSHQFPLTQDDWKRRDTDWRLISIVETRGTLLVK
ncbi:MAG: hypothetical protein JRH20_22250 [Deltaproteobacteria bacterium]|nr:hypothetical protein [Deltaproteobacteria bacterium]